MDAIIEIRGVDFTIKNDRQHKVVREEKDNQIEVIQESRLRKSEEKYSRRVFVLLHLIHLFIIPMMSPHEFTLFKDNVL